MDTLLPSKPGSYHNLLKRSLKLYRASFKHVISLTFILAVIVFLPREISLIIGQDIFMDMSVASPHRLWLLLVDLASLMFYLALIWRIRCVIKGIHEPFIEDLTRAIQKMSYVFVAAVIQTVILFAVATILYGVLILLQHQHLSIAKPMGFLIAYAVFASQLFLILYVFTLFFFYIPLIAIENRGIVGSLERSVYLVWNHWWRVFSLQTTPWIFYLIALIAVRYILNINVHIYFLERTTPDFISTIIHIFLFALFAPWTASLLLVQLRDLELRKHIVTNL